MNPRSTRSLARTSAAILALTMLGGALAAGPALADSWDTLGSKHQRQVTRYGHFDQHPGRGKAWGRDRQRTEVNIIVAPRAPISAWAPRWNERQDRRHNYRGHDPVYNSSLGFMAGAIVGLVAAPQLTVPRYYERYYGNPTVVTERYGNGRSFSLYKDRFGACYERETDRHGRVINRRVADYNCNF